MKFGDLRYQMQLLAQNSFTCVRCNVKFINTGEEEDEQ
jgi:hypothetical protein